MVPWWPQYIRNCTDNRPGGKLFHRDITGQLCRDFSFPPTQSCSISKVNCARVCSEWFAHVKILLCKLTRYVKHRLTPAVFGQIVDSSSREFVGLPGAYFLIPLVELLHGLRQKRTECEAAKHPAGHPSKVCQDGL